MTESKVVIDLNQIKVIEKFFDLITKAGLINLAAEDIQHFIKDAKSLTIQSACLKTATEKAVKESGLLSNELKEAKRCIISITGDANVTLSDLDTIIGAISSFHKCEYNFSSLYDEHQKGYKVDVFLAKV